nr:hypothetical protein [Tanacetum cinerariifolium]
MMQLVPVEEVYVEALQVKHPIIDWEIHTEGQRSYWMIIRLGGSTASYQFFIDMLKHFDREDLNQLWALVKETLNIRQATSDKEKELWVELKRLYEPDVEDQLDEFPLPEDFSTTSEERFPLLRTPCPIKGVLRRTTIVEVLKELPKISMVNSSLKKLKIYLASFDVVVKERTTATAITEGTWGFEHTKACFRDEIILFLKALEDLFNSFDQFLIDELTETELSAEQVFWSQNFGHYEEPNLSTRTTIVEVPKELSKVSMVNSSLKKLKFHLASFDVVVKERTTATAITEEVDTQPEQEIFQRNNSFSQQSVPSFDQLFEINDLKAQSQEKDTIIMKLKERIKVTKLVTENEHLKQTYKQLYDSIKSSRVRSKEQCDDLIKQVNIKSVENLDLNASLQEKALVITALKDTLSKLKGKAVVDEAVTLHPIDPELLRIDVAPLTPKLRNNMTTHYDYLKILKKKPLLLGK